MYFYTLYTLFPINSYLFSVVSSHKAKQRFETSTPDSKQHTVIPDIE